MFSSLREQSKCTLVVPIKMTIPTVARTQHQARARLCVDEEYFWKFLTNKPSMEQQMCTLCPHGDKLRNQREFVTMKPTYCPRDAAVGPENDLLQTMVQRAKISKHRLLVFV